MEALGCLQPAWGAQEAARPWPTEFSGYRPNAWWDRVLGDDLQTPEGRRSEYFGMIPFFHTNKEALRSHIECLDFLTVY